MPADRAALRAARFAVERTVTATRQPALALMFAGLASLALWLAFHATFPDAVARYARVAAARGPAALASYEETARGPLVRFLLSPGLRVVSILAALMTVLGGWSMWRLQSRGTALVGAVCALLPVTAFGLAIPFGIWALFALTDPEVKRLFAVEPPPAD